MIVIGIACCKFFLSINPLIYQRLREEKKTTDILIKGFLSSQNLSGLDWREFAFDSGLCRTDMMVTLKKFAQWYESTLFSLSYRK